MKAHRLFATKIWLTGFCVNVSAQATLPDNMVEADCITEVQAMTWGVVSAWSSSTIVSNFNTPLVGDLDGDGYLELKFRTLKTRRKNEWVKKVLATARSSGRRTIPLPWGRGDRRPG